MKLVTGLPKLGHWLAQAWPPKLDELPLFLLRTAETVAMAAIGTTAATVLAMPMAVLGEPQHHAVSRACIYPARWFLNALRGIDSFVFALLFVAAVGLGPFAGVLGIALHTWGSAAKFFADHIENAQMGPLDAVRTTGAGRYTALVYALLPDVLPVLASTTLFWWEFNVRASTVLGVVGAGGIGQELKNSMDLLDFSRLFTIIAVILIVVTALDQLSSWLRRRLIVMAAALIGACFEVASARSKAFDGQAAIAQREFPGAARRVCRRARAERRGQDDAVPMPRRIDGARCRFSAHLGGIDVIDIPRPGAPPHRRRVPAVQPGQPPERYRKRAGRPPRPCSGLARLAAALFAQPITLLALECLDRVGLLDQADAARRYPVGRAAAARRDRASAGAAARCHHRGRAGRQPRSAHRRGHSRTAALDLPCAAKRRRR